MIPAHLDLRILKKYNLFLILICYRCSLEIYERKIALRN